MPKIATTVRVTVPVSGEDVVFVCRRPKAKEVSAFLNGRFETKRNKVKSKLYCARREFIDGILIDMENATFEAADRQERELSARTELTQADKDMWTGILGEPVESWKDLVPLNWKSSAAMSFEDPANQDGEETEGD